MTLFCLLALACISELFCLLIVALAPLPALHLSSTPLPNVWSWTLFPSHILVILYNYSPAITSNHTGLPSLLLGLTFTGLLAAYAYAIRVTHRSCIRAQQRYLYLLLAGALLFGVTILFQPLLFSDDVFTYMFSGRLMTVYGTDPLNTAPIQFPHDPYLVWVFSGRNSPNIFGPLWLCITALLSWISNDPAISLLLFKGCALIAHLINCLLIWVILGKIAPARQVTGALLYAWNPLALIELAGGGHNVGLLTMFILLALWLYVQGQKRVLVVGSLLLLGLAISINFVTLLLAPLFAWFDMRTERNMARATWGFCWRLLLMFLPVVLILLPFWRGATTFFAITSAIDMEHFIHAPISTLTFPIRALFQGFARWAHFPAFLQPVSAADITVRASAIFIFILIYMHLFAQVRDVPTSWTNPQDSSEGDAYMRIPGFEVLLTGWACAIFWYLVLVSGWFWPWYVLWLPAVTVLRRLDAFTITLLLLSGTALFIYPFVGFSRAPMVMYQAGLIFGLPILYFIVATVRHQYSERISHHYDRRSNQATSN